MAADKIKQTGAHFTPKELADLVAERLAKYVARLPGNLRILDPACGDGNLLLAMADALPSDVLSRSTIVGIENDRAAYNTLMARLQEKGPCSTDLIMGDFLDYVDDGTMFSVTKQLEPVDVVIANPPYVRTQVLGAQRAQTLASKFGLEGRVDLYQAFLVAMIDSLRPGGVLGVITSNRFLTTKSGFATRRFLRSQLDLLEIVDLGDTKLFEAAVLPALIFGTRRERPREASEPVSVDFVRVYSLQETDHAAVVVESIPSTLRNARDGRYRVNGTTFEVATGLLTAPSDSSQPWVMHTSEEGDWVRLVDDHATCRVHDVAKVRVGIKTTADKVFIRSDWDSLPKHLSPESKYLRPLLSQRNAARWMAQDAEGNSLKVLYTHESVDGKRKAIAFPEDSKAWRYLLSHRERLESRKYVIDAGRQWYEVWVPQDPSAWALPKIVFPDISPEARFFLDQGGSIVDGNCYWISTSDPQDEDILMLILGVANSSTMARYHELSFQNRLYAHRRRYLTQYVQQYPLPDRNSAEAAEIIRLVAKHISMHGSQTEYFQAELDSVVASAFGVESPQLMGTQD